MAFSLNISSLLYKLKIGKYKGHTIGDLIINDPTYCEWLFKQNWVKVDKSVLNAFNTYLFYAR